MSETVTDAPVADTSLKFANKTLQDYEVISVIGNGTFGTCFKVRDKATGQLYAWKGMDYDELSEQQKQALVSEISVLRQLQHPNIVQYHHHLVNHEAKSIFIVMECCEGGDLAQLITKARVERRRFEEKYVWRVLFQVCKALQVCHNKIEQGTILHRDIKPANIFLDEAGNAKLGDFGLARMLRRNESFAQTFVGTPYYMSPELVKGSKYDRKSDVWAVGCLVYEMCALRPPFKGYEFEQLSLNIANGKFNNIPDVYSRDLQDIIAFMLAVENNQRPSIEVIIRHPIVVRNISELGSEFPRLIEVEEDFYVIAAGNVGESSTRCKLSYSPAPELSTTTFSEQNSFNEEYGQRRLSTVFTPDLRAELFYSAKRRIYTRPEFQLSDPELYESIRHADYAFINDTKKPISAQPKASEENPESLTQKIFDQFLQDRLHAIRAQESLLERRELDLNERERQLSEKEKRLNILECQLEEKLAIFESNQQPLKTETSTRKTTTNSIERSRLPLPAETRSNVSKSLPLPTAPPPIPPRKPKPHDDTYCCIDDSLMQPPTMVKLNLAALPAPRTFSALRKVTFQSPQKFIKYDIESVASKTPATATIRATTKQKQSTQMQASVSSKGSDDSSEGSTTTTTNRRKSILSIFGLHRNNNKEAPKPSQPPQPSILKQRTPLAPKAAEQVLAKCETTELSNIWTKEHKRAAFDLLAAMNAAERESECGRNTTAATSRHKLRQSVRERSSSLQRNRLRRSLVVAPPLASAKSLSVMPREQLVV